jgi:hypothetical protein
MHKQNLLTVRIRQEVDRSWKAKQEEKFRILGSDDRKSEWTYRNKKIEPRMDTNWHSFLRIKSVCFKLISAFIFFPRFFRLPQ